MQVAQGQPDKPHRASIAFPPRRTADGKRISSLPVAEAQRVLAELTGASGAAAAADSQSGEQPPWHVPQHLNIMLLQAAVKL
jgi:hypothetical protein